MATVRENTCFCQICHNVRETISQIFIVLEKYGWLLDSYIVDFYEDDSWNKLPASWINFLDATTPGELGSWILKENSNNRVWPLSLQALRRAVELLQINRDPGGEIELKCENLMNENEKKTMEPNSMPFKISKELETGKRDSNACSVHPKLRNLFAKHVKPKKKHEIDLMAEVIADCAASANSECAADVGAGMGHLARTLAYKYDMCVTCVEQQSPLSEQARKLDGQFESMALKYVPDFRGQKPRHISLKMERDLSGSSLFVDRLKNEFENKFILNQKSLGFGLIGLHPCGDLATTLLQCYADSEWVNFICIAGCCYMKLTLGDESEALRSYPLSKYLRSSRMNKLSYAALEVACHAVENHCQKLKSAEYWELKIHAYRAALESHLIERSPSLRHEKLKNVKLRKNTTFREYCIAATETLRREDGLESLEEFENPRTSRFLERWERVVIFGSLRFMLAPLVESVVLLDRFLYLSEKNLSPKLKAVFDPLISPRNFLLTSVK